jgi:hypothetical protein
MDIYAIENIVENALLGVTGATLAGVPVVQGITDSFDEAGAPILLGESHIAIYVPNIDPLHPQNEKELIWTCEAVLMVATWQDEVGTGIRDLHETRKLALRNRIWQDNLKAVLTNGQLTVARVVIGGCENSVIGRHHASRHHLALFGIAISEAP